MPDHLLVAPAGRTPCWGIPLPVMGQGPSTVLQILPVRTGGAQHTWWICPQQQSWVIVLEVIGAVSWG